MTKFNMNQASSVVPETVSLSSSSSPSSSLRPSSSSSLKRSFASSSTEEGFCTPAKKKTRRFHHDHHHHQSKLTERTVPLPPATTTPGKNTTTTLPPRTPKTTSSAATTAQTTATKKKRRVVMITSPTPRRPISTVNLLSRRKATTPRSTSVSTLASCDRFIPNRRNMNIELCRRRLLSDLENDENDNRGRPNSEEEEEEEETETNRNNRKKFETSVEREYRRRMLSEICNVPLSTLDEHSRPKSMLATSSSSSSSVLSNKTLSSVITTDPRSLDILHVHSHRGIDDDSLSRSKSVLRRKIPDKPKRVLDGPGLINDFYVNHMSWSKGNVLAVLLENYVYLWNNTTRSIQHLATVRGEGHVFTSVEWSTTNARYLVAGTNRGVVQLWDTEASRLIRAFQGHQGRVAALAWNQHWVSSGGQDSFILQHDIRSPAPFVSTYHGHDQQVVGLKWNEEGTALASGGNDNMVCIWDSTMSSSTPRLLGGGSNHFVSPRLRLRQHEGAVKALDWCPLRRGVLASGGGSADRCIKLWNTNSGFLLNSVDTFSQVCELAWSKDRLELCSAHGFPNNSLMLWEYTTAGCDGGGGESGGGSGSSSASYTKKLTKIKELTGPISDRVLSMACSPDGETVVSASADERICFWDISGASAATKSGRGSRVRGGTADMDLLGELTFGMPSIR